MKKDLLIVETRESKPKKIKYEDLPPALKKQIDCMNNEDFEQEEKEINDFFKGFKLLSLIIKDKLRRNT